MSQLVKCTSCARHVRPSESACPFCAATLDVATQTANAQAIRARIPRGRFSRAALLAVGLGAVVPAINACGSDDTSDENGAQDAGKDDAASIDASVDGMAHTLYGLPGDASMIFLDAPDDVHSFSDAYGAPPPIDSGEDASDAGDAGDGGDADAD
jgi:hypothetical protein